MKNIANYFLNLPTIDNMMGFSDELNLSLGLLQQINNRKDLYYKEVEIPKKNKGTRTLAVPSKRIKAIQGWILRNILDNLYTHPSATAFKTKTNVRTNLDMHYGKSFFLCIDIEDFFTNISMKYVFNFFRVLGYNNEVAHFLSSFCTYKGSLPQGGVTSPALSNLINIRLDRRFSGLARSQNLSYSRYADDITFSSTNPDKLLKVMNTIKSIIDDEGYRLNSHKTRILRPGNQRKITGLVVAEDGEISIGRKQRRILRSTIYNYVKSDQINEEIYLYIKGWFAYLQSVDKKSYKYLKSYLDKLQNSESKEMEGDKVFTM